MEKTSWSLLGAILLFGCASSGGGSGAETVPVYTRADQIPCQYEVLETVRASGLYDITTPGAFKMAQARALSRAGARVEADAVFVPPPDPGERGRRMEITGRVVPLDKPINAPIPVTFMGQAIRFIPGTCGR